MWIFLPIRVATRAAVHTWSSTQPCAAGPQLEKASTRLYPHTSHTTEYSQHSGHIRTFAKDHPDAPKSVMRFTRDALEAINGIGRYLETSR
ncbi:hypothetical protein AR457_36825 [Streptomyces agglomeratus]|uniref:hypothetical protein n=1 Tax=Streptomyces agglomeratus TaxID=285458 RepID=UPI0008547AAE|nr:hypothetical protein [Streptomyces agglomeratus]OEJ22819.1 hypothetical protein AR457_36825 [Streptomyces agglomeratus]